MVIFTETEMNLTLSQIDIMETFVGLKFPQEYKDHLMKYNGGQCTPNTFEFYENGKLTESNVDWFLAIYDGEYDNLKDYIQIFKFDEKRLPKSVLPIAHDPGGNLICIDCGEEKEGYVYFWNHENEPDSYTYDYNDYSNLYLIKESFNEFIASLKEDSDSLE